MDERDRRRRALDVEQDDARAQGGIRHTWLPEGGAGKYIGPKHTG
jgi:hypothetical protein